MRWLLLHHSDPAQSAEDSSRTTVQHLHHSKQCQYNNNNNYYYYYYYYCYSVSRGQFTHNICTTAHSTQHTVSIQQQWQQKQQQQQELLLLLLLLLSQPRTVNKVAKYTVNTTTKATTTTTTTTTTATTATTTQLLLLSQPWTVHSTAHSRSTATNYNTCSSCKHRRGLKRLGPEVAVFQQTASNFCLRVLTISIVWEFYSTKFCTFRRKFWDNK